MPAAIVAVVAAVAGGAAAATVTSVVMSVVVGAVVGAAVGAIGTAIIGGDVTKGAIMGAIGGGIGGAVGAMSAVAEAPAAGGMAMAGEADVAGLAAAEAAASPTLDATMGGAFVGTETGKVAAVVPPPPPAEGLLSKATTALTSDKGMVLAGGVLSGYGEMEGGKAQAEATRDAARVESDQRAATEAAKLAEEAKGKKLTSRLVAKPGTISTGQPVNLSDQFRREFDNLRDFTASIRPTIKPLAPTVAPVVV